MSPTHTQRAVASPVHPLASFKYFRPSRRTVQRFRQPGLPFCICSGFFYFVVSFPFLTIHHLRRNVKPREKHKLQLRACVHVRSVSPNISLGLTKAKQTQPIRPRNVHHSVWWALGQKTESISEDTFTQLRVGVHNWLGSLKTFFRWLF